MLLSMQKVPEKTPVSKLPWTYLLDLVATSNADDYVVSVEECEG
jgi:hypothetical protein